MGSSLNSLGRLALTGAGYYFGGPAGALLGGIAGNFLFPQKLPTIEGPRIGDAPATSAAQGAPIAIVYGTINVAGNVIWDAGFVERRNTKKVGGKGGAPKQKVVTYTYTRSYAVALCEGQIEGVLRAWRNTKLVYDIRPVQPGESQADFEARLAVSEGFLEGCTIYLGTESQLPDPTIEATQGVGTVPAFRGIAYIVFTDEDVTDIGARTPQWMFEVSRSVDTDGSTVTEYSNEVLFPWLDGEPDPRNCLNDHRYKAGGAPWRTTLDAAIQDFETASGESVESGLIAWTPSFSIGSFPQDAGVSADEFVTLFFAYGQQNPDRTEGYQKGVAGGRNYGCEFPEVSGAALGEVIWWNGYGDSLMQKSPRGFYVWYEDEASPPPGFSWDFLNRCPWPVPGADAAQTRIVRRANDVPIDVERLPRAPDNPCDPRCGPAPPLFPENPNYCVIGDTLKRNLEWTYVAGTWRVLQAYADNNSVVTKYPLNPARPEGHPQYDDQEFWEAAYDSAVELGLMDPGFTYGLQYPVLQGFAYQRTYSVTTGEGLPVTLGSIVEDLCERSAPLTAADVDVSDLTELVLGYKVERIISGRDAIEPLRSYGFFDSVESDGLLKFPTRGKASVATLDADTLGASNETNTAQPLVSLQRQEDVELPRTVRVHYLLPDSDYAAGEQKYGRLVTSAVNVEDVELAISMTDDKAAQIAQVLLAERWVGRETYACMASPALLELEPGDAITLPVEGSSQRGRIQSISLGGLLTLEVVRDEATLYTSTAVGVPSVGGQGGVSYAGVTTLLIIDAPALSEAQNDAGLYLAAYGQGPGWRGAGVYQSIDGGANYELVAEIEDAATMATLSDALPDVDHHIWDRGSVVRVQMLSGTLESATEDAVLAGANRVFVGAAGRWEVAGFTTATLVSAGVYDLSGWVRGLKGTEWVIGSSESGDTLVLTAECTRLPLSASALGAARQIVAAADGTSIEANAEQTVTPAGFCLRAFAPAHLECQRNTAGDLTFTWARRATIFGGAYPYISVPLYHPQERYVLQLYATATFDEYGRLASGTAVHEVTLTSESYELTAAEFAAIESAAGVDLSTFVVTVFESGSVSGAGELTPFTMVYR